MRINLLNSIVLVVLLVLFLFTPNLKAQEKITVELAGTFTWSDLVQRDINKLSEPQRFIPPPQPGPGPREISSKIPLNIPGEMKSGAPADATGTLSFPTLSFDGLLDNNTVIPPDTHGSVGPSHLMTMLNSQVRIQTKTGTNVSTVSLSSFWSPLPGSPFDPRLHYDAINSRWIAICAVNGNSTSSKVNFAISSTSDPTGTWKYYQFDADSLETTRWADYPTVGFNNTWIAITANMFTVAVSPSFRGAKMWVIDKSTALAGGALTVSIFLTDFDNVGGGDGSTLQPCITHGSEGTLYIVDNSGWSAGGTYLIRISRITGTGSSPSWSVIPGSIYSGSGWFFVINNFTWVQADADQLGLATKIETNDPRMMNAVFRNGRIWCTHNAGLPAGSSADRTAIFWYQLNPTISSPIVQSGVIDGGSGIHHYFPSISANSSNDVCIGFTRSSSSVYAQVAYTGRLNTDPLGTVIPIQIIKLGESSYTKFFGGTQNRWGDYSNTCVDPTDDQTFWTIQEYAGTKVGSGVDDGRWGTRWAKILSPSDLPIQLASFYAEPISVNNVRVIWQTVSETNNYGFYVEKYNETSDVFETIESSFRAGAGYSLEPMNYSWIDENAVGQNIQYRLKQIDNDGLENFFGPILLNPNNIVENEVVPAIFALSQNYPNPFNPSTKISFRLANSGYATLKVYNLLGQEVSTVFSGNAEAGKMYDLDFDASNLTSGMYFYKLQSGNSVEVRKLTLVK